MAYENTKKEPLIRIAKRPELPSGKAMLIRFSSVLVALLIGGLLILALGFNPVAVYGDIVKGSLLSGTALKATAKIAVPLLGAALAIAPAFKMKFWNCGAEGQITVGAIASTFFALKLIDHLSGPVFFIVTFIVSVCDKDCFFSMITVYHMTYRTVLVFLSSRLYFCINICTLAKVIERI